MMVLTYPNSTRIAVSTVSALLIVVLALASRRGEVTFYDAAFTVLLLAFCAVANLSVYRTRVLIAENELVYVTLIRSLTLKWDEIDDIQISPHLVVISSARQNKRLVFVRGEYGLSLEPFEVLVEKLMGRTWPRLAQSWAKLEPPLTFVSQWFVWDTVWAYSIPLGLVLLFFALFIIRIEGMLVEKLLFLGLSLLILVPFMLRDYRKTKLQFIVQKSGLRVTDGKETFIPWESVKEILVTKAFIGEGSVVVKADGGKRIAIPRSLMQCGQLLYLIKRNTNLSETYGLQHLGCLL